MKQQDLSFFAALPEGVVDDFYKRWLQGDELPQDWQHFFSGYQVGLDTAGTDCIDQVSVLKHSGVQSLIYRYRDLGHLMACTDPLSLCPVRHPLLELSQFGLAEEDLETFFSTRRHHLQKASLRQFVEVLQETYCRDIGVEFMHIQHPDKRQWLIDRMEPVLNRPLQSLSDRLLIMEKLHAAVLFESFLHRKFPGQKRFSLEGGEVLIPMLEVLVQACPDAGVTDLVMGMSHRGRLNVLANIFDKPYETIFAEFHDTAATGFSGDGDVKYHKGMSTNRALSGGGLHLVLASNPSHLEAVDPVVQGKSRARQDRIGADGKKMVLPLLVHGDAAFAGQGLVAEVLNMSQLDGYCTGGTIHIVINNQIGFTTRPRDARSTRYATDLAKMLSCPIFHIHGESPDAAAHCARLALAYRQTFCEDLVLELICYRRYGHNEGDEPAFTQPVMYHAIAERPPVNRIYAEKLIGEGVEQALLDGMATQISARLEDALAAEPHPRNIGFREQWDGVERNYQAYEQPTGLPVGQLKQLAVAMTTVPDRFMLHPKLATLLKKREEAVRSGTDIDWGTAETLAYASLLSEGHSVRLSGQDSRRGTFNHRHAVLYDRNDGQPFTPLAEIATAASSRLHIYDSLLSESGVLGFEYGYSLETPNGLTLWEAQFGDFANGAQVIIDQFVASGETKWNRASGLVMLLPHGYEGQGAEHSSARIERYLQLCAKHNLLVTQPSTPAQFFHLLRRQLKQPFRKPLIVFTPKSLLRHPVCSSLLGEFSEGSHFQELLVTGELGTARRVLLCSGKIYYELLKRITEQGRDAVTLIRLEQLYPLRFELLESLLDACPVATEFVWVQEEPENMGAWSFLQQQFQQSGRTVRFIGRDADSCSAVGSHHLHDEQQLKILEQACS